MSWRLYRCASWAADRVGSVSTDKPNLLIIMALIGDFLLQMKPSFPIRWLIPHYYQNPPQAKRLQRVKLSHKPCGSNVFPTLPSTNSLMSLPQANILRLWITDTAAQQTKCELLQSYYRLTDKLQTLKGRKQEISIWDNQLVFNKIQKWSMIINHSR